MHWLCVAIVFYTLCLVAPSVGLGPMLAPIFVGAAAGSTWHLHSYQTPGGSPAGSVGV